MSEQIVAAATRAREAATVLALATRAANLIASLLQRQLDLPPLVLARTAMRGLRCERRLDPERLQALYHFGSDVAVAAHAAERDTAISAMIDEATPAVITAGIAAGAGVGDMQLAPAMATA